MSDFSPDEISDRRFATSFRGFDTGEVKLFLARVAQQVTDHRAREVTLQHRLDELIDATTPTTMGRDDPAVAPQEPAEVTRTFEAAQAALAGAHGEASSIVARAHEEAARIVLRARVEGHIDANAEALVANVDQAAVRDEARAMVNEAKAVRERILTDLAKRRRVANVQLEQLRAAREKLLETLREARKVVDDAARDLSTAEVEARVAADLAGRRAGLEPVPSAAEIEEELVAARHFGVAILDGGRDRRSVSETGSADSVRPQAVDPSAAGVELQSQHVDDRDDAGAPVAKLDDLFARLRAEREAATERAHAVLTPALERASSEPAPPGESPDAPLNLSAQASDAAAAAPDTDGGTLGSLSQPDSPGEAAAHQQTRRDQALELIEARLVRSLKRALQDEQSAALANVRTARGRPELAEVLPAPEHHAQAYTDAARAALVEAAAAGRGLDDLQSPFDQFLPSELVDYHVTVLVDHVTGELREAVALALRLAHETESPEAELIDAVSAIYREWRTERVAGVAREQLIAAYAAGVGRVNA